MKHCSTCVEKCVWKARWRSDENIQISKPPKCKFAP